MYARASDLLQRPLEMTITTSEVGGSFDPDIFGPPFWFTLHNAAVAYYDRPNDVVKSMMKSFIKSLPVVIPCVKCKEHAHTYLRHQNIDLAVQNRKNLFDFFLQFHNYVNAKGGRPAMSLKDAQELYGYFRRGGRGTMKITYV